MKVEDVKIFKKDGSIQKFNGDKIKNAISKSAERAVMPLSEADKEKVVTLVRDKIEEMGVLEIQIPQMHFMVENALDEVNPAIAKSYRDYRNYKHEFVNMMDDVYKDAQKIMFQGDKENSNKDSALVSTKGCLIRSKLMKEFYKKFFLTERERQIIKDGYIYIHDMDMRLLTMNCCLFDAKNVLKGGFEMGNLWYNEPKTLDVAYDVIGDVVLSAASQQYGGFTIPRVDSLLVPYAEKSHALYFKKALALCEDREKALDYADKELEKEFEQGFQGWEYKFNSVGSSRGDYPFITVTSGLDTSKFGIMCNKVMFRVHKNGQGKKGCKKPVLFPKYVFLYDKNTNGPDSDGHEIYEAALDCSTKTMYPDWLSLCGDSYQSDMFQKYGEVISPMGCRAFLSPYWRRGGQAPADENDTPVFEGRFNSGAISLNLPLIYLQAITENKPFYYVLEYYMEIIRGLHKRTKEYLGNLKASTNPLAFCEGGFYGGNLRPEQKLKESPILLDATTWSYGITALNELQRAYNGKSISEDGEFAHQVMEFLNEKLEEYKKEDHMLWAVYGTPAENLCGLQITQLREFTKNHVMELTNAGYDVTYDNNKNAYIIPEISSHEYVSNSFHCHVTEDISPVQKQDAEKRFWNLHKGGEIQYIRYPIGYNKKSIETLINRAMDLGFYEGVNLSLAYCDDCGHEELEMDVCPVCGSKNLTKIDRMNGYLSFSRIHGNTRLNDAKMAEIAERKSM